MTILVDELQSYPQRASSAQARRHFGEGRKSCHLTVSVLTIRGEEWLPGDALASLHAFAKKIGLDRAWFQDHRLLPHYDLTERRRTAALKAGAVFVPIRSQLRLRREILARKPESE
jgi:hypothetical protein